MSQSVFIEGRGSETPLSVAVGTWWTSFASAYHLSELPRDYLSFHVHTTGLEEDDLVAEIGHLCVRDGTVVDRGSRIVNWYLSPIDAHKLTGRLEYTRSQMEASGVACRHTPTRLQNEGEDPWEVLGDYQQMLKDWQRGGGVFLAHNGLKFGVPFLEDSFDRCFVNPWRFDRDTVLDVGAICKGVFMGELADSDRSMGSYLGHLLDIPAPGVRWSLQHCVESFVPPADRRPRSHEYPADHDAYLVHLVFEGLRRHIAPLRGSGAS